MSANLYEREPGTHTVAPPIKTNAGWIRRCTCGWRVYTSDRNQAMQEAKQHRLRATNYARLVKLGLVEYVHTTPKPLTDQEKAELRASTNALRAALNQIEWN